MAWNYNKLKGKIIEIFGTQRAFSEAIGLSYTSLNQRLNGHLQFSQDEIFKSCDALGIDYKDIPLYFFTILV